MSEPNETAAYCADLVSGLADGGVDTVFVSPGSRNTPLTLAFAREPRITDLSIRDERSAGFAALGYGKATGRPAVVLCTSGSAATHYFPSIVEADQSAAPLIVLTADRPSHLRGTGAPQTMDQMNLYGSHVKSFTDLDVRSAQGKSEGAILAAISLALPSGPVHANIAFDEPLLPTDLPPIPASNVRSSPVPEGMTHGNPLESLVGKDVIIVAGGHQMNGFGAAVNAVAAALGAPVIADPQCWTTGPHTIRFGDLLASSTNALETAPPDAILRLGPIPTSKPIWRWLEQSGIDQILVDKSRLGDPLAAAETVIDADPTAFLTANVPTGSGAERYLAKWLAMDSDCATAVTDALDVLPFPNEPRIARALIAAVSPGDLVHLGSSMPIRDVDQFAAPRSDITVLANRGVNGIDGTISTALGAALSGERVTVLVGDVAALHDATAIAEVARLDARMRIVVVNNDGGGIFSFLPQSRADVVPHDVYERHWGTPHGLSLCDVAHGFGMKAARVKSLDEFVAAVSAKVTTPELIELRTNRTDNAAHHGDVRRAVRTVGI